ncbi:MAG: restriction endonuclease subunit S [Cyanobacteriota bacterium]
MGKIFMNKNMTIEKENKILKKGYKQTEIGVIPDDWSFEFLGNLGQFKNGINKGNEDFGYGSPFVNLMDVFGVSSISETNHLGLINSTILEKNVYDLREGDVLFIRSSVKPSGVGLTSVIEKNLKNTVYSGFLIRYRDNSKISNEFKKYCFSSEKFRKSIISSSTISANTNINQESLKNIILLFPTKIEEQKAIAQALSDVNSLINSIEKTISKKRDIKTATMQQLLTGKKRLAGFGEGKGYKQTEIGFIPEDWELLYLKDVLKVRHGKNQKEVEDINGKYPILGTGGLMSYSKSFLYDKESVLIGRKGTIDKPQFMNTPFWTVDTLFYTEINKNSIPKFLYYKFLLIDWYSYNEASGVPSLNASRIENIKSAIPKNEEQKAIAQILTDMDDEIKTLENKLEKTKLIKQGMMQELLTGKTRLL